MKNFIVSIVLPFLLFAEGPKEHYLVVGTYTGGKSEGIYIYKFNSEDGSFKAISHIKTPNPSYVAISPDEKFVFAVTEGANDGNGGAISSFYFDKANGTLSFINKQPTNGDHPCYVDIDKTGKWVFAGNYSSGSLSAIPVNPDGTLGISAIVVKHSGTGKNPERQEKPHVHCTIVSPDNKFLYVPDLGIDKVMIYSIDV